MMRLIYYKAYYGANTAKYHYHDGHAVWVDTAALEIPTTKQSDNDF